MSDSRRSGKTSLWRGRLALSVILVVASLLFVFSNRHPVEIAFFGLYFTLPMWIWFVILLGTGVLVGWMRPWRRSDK